MIETNEPYTLQEIEKVKECFVFYIKTVIDVNKKVCVSGMNMHVDGEKLLLAKGSNQADIWGGGIDVLTKDIDFQSMINIRPNQNNPSNVILDRNIQRKYVEFTKFFFKNLK